MFLVSTAQGMQITASGKNLQKALGFFFQHITWGRRASEFL